MRRRVRAPSWQWFFSNDLRDSNEEVRRMIAAWRRALPEHMRNAEITSARIAHDELYIEAQVPVSIEQVVIQGKVTV